MSEQEREVEGHGYRWNEHEEPPQSVEEKADAEREEQSPDVEH